MIAYKPVHARPLPDLGQAARTIQPSVGVPPPTIDPVFAGYEGWQGILTNVLVLAATGTGAYLGITTALQSQDKTKKAIGWVAGVGAALAGLLYIGGKSGLTIGTGIPAVNVYPA